MANKRTDATNSPGSQSTQDTKDTNTFTYTEYLKCSNSNNQKVMSFDNDSSSTFFTHESKKIVDICENFNVPNDPSKFESKFQ